MPPPTILAGTKRILPTMTPRNLLICFDAFGTLFKPRAPIEQQYGEVARSLGLAGIRDDDVRDSFKTAFKREAKAHPNFGKRSGLGAERWWASIIQNTFRPLLPPTQQDLPPDLVPKLLHRFWSNEGYTIFPDVQPLLQTLRQHYSDRLVVGVITNSDPRVPDVLSSLGLRVSPLRYGGETKGDREGQWDVDFTVMSYDVGHEKPDRCIFEAAEKMLGEDLLSKPDAKETVHGAEWRKVYVGDEYEKDVVGAVGAGWNAVLIDREASTTRDDVRWLDNQQPSDFESMFATSQAVGFSSLAKLALWLPKPRL